MQVLVKDHKAAVFTRRPRSRPESASTALHSKQGGLATGTVKNPILLVSGRNESTTKYDHRQTFDQQRNLYKNWSTKAKWTI